MLEFWKNFVVFVGAGFSIFGVTPQPISENSSIRQDRKSSPIYDYGPDRTTSESFTYHIDNFYSDDDLEDQMSGLDQSAIIGKPINETQDKALAASSILPTHNLENQTKTILPGSITQNAFLKDDVIPDSSVEFHDIELNLLTTPETFNLIPKHGGNDEKNNVLESNNDTNLKNKEHSSSPLLPLQEKLVFPISSEPRTNKTQDKALAASPILPNHDLENQAKTIFPGSSSEKVLLQDDVIHDSIVNFHHIIGLNSLPIQKTLNLVSKHGGNDEKNNVSESDTGTNLKNKERDCRSPLLPLQEKLVFPISLGSSTYISNSEFNNNNYQETFSGSNSETFVKINEYAKDPFDFEDSGSEYLPSSGGESTSEEEDLAVSEVKNTYSGKKTKIISNSKGKVQLDLPNTEHIMESDDNREPSTSSEISEELTSENNHLECQKFNQCYKNDVRPFFEPAVGENQKYTRKPSARERPTICPICYHDVITHFTRHLFRHHGDHKDVKVIKSLNPRSKERLSMVAALRKQGYFHLNVEKNVINPVRSSKLPNTEYFACPYCLGHYSKKLLHKHVKLCINKPENIISPGKHCLSKSQSVVASIMSKNNDFLRKSRIHKEVFNVMRADDISAVAKSDPLICLYGETLISKHKREQVTSFISNKMREMARMLMVIRTIESNVIGLFDVLKPEMFQTLLQAAKKISGYDPGLKEFRAPSLALHMGTNLKTICDIAFKLVIEGRQIPNINWTDKMEKKAHIKDLKKLLEGHWCNELSSLALKNLKERQWETPKQLPLSDDILSLQKYLDNLSLDCYEKLKYKTDIKKNYKILIECLLAQTIMFNRKRVGDVQFLKLETYLKDTQRLDQEAFTKNLTTVEKILCKNFKRVVTGGKGSKPVPILLSKQTQKYMDFLLQLRNTCDLIPESNPYIFAAPGSKKWIYGANVIRRFALNCGAKHPQLLSSVRFRKHIATTLQLMNMEPQEMEQIATFMGHMEKTHAEFYSSSSMVTELQNFIVQRINSIVELVCSEEIHKTSFSCDGRTSGYYADVGSGCQVYHMCDGLGRQFSYKCPKNTLFQQRMLICDHWYMVNCSKAEEDYSANLLIGQQGKAFIEDLQFQRTPRPDLAGMDFNLYRTTQGAISTKNLVGAEENDSHFATDGYFPPTHWSTEFSAPSTTPAPRKREESDTGVSGLAKQIFYSTNYRTGKRFLSKKGKNANNSNNRVDNSDATRFKAKTNDQKIPLPSGVNFPSSFKATTPVYPKNLGIDVSKFTDFANAPEETENSNNNKNPIANFPSNYQGTTPLFPFYVDYSSASLSIYDMPSEDTKTKSNNFINFASDFQATTPVFPLHVEVVEQLHQKAEFDYPIIEDLYDDLSSVTFTSKFEGTTPVYPRVVDVDLSKFSGSEEIAPGQNNYSGDEVVVNFPSDFKATTPVYPKEVDVDLSKFSGSEEVAPASNSETTNNNVVVNFASNFKATTPVYPKEVDVDLSKFYGSEETAPGESGAHDDVVVNFASNYKGTTPVYPLDAGIDSSKYSGSEELPPNQSDQDDVIVNFASSFKATTPVYPKEVNIDLSKFGEPEELPEEKSNSRTNVDLVANCTEATTPDSSSKDNAPATIPEDFGLLPPHQSGDSQSAANNDLFGLVPPRQAVDEEPIRLSPQPSDKLKQTVNFGSNYQATTPVYPESVEPSSPDPNEVGLLAPKSNIAYSLPSQDIQPPSFESTFKRRIDEDDPSLLGNTFSSQQLNRFMVTIRPEQLREIQELWRIPEYDFPLDSGALRPSYESHYNSFQANVKAAKTR